MTLFDLLQLDSPVSDSSPIQLQSKTGPCHIQLRMTLPLMTPYFNRWGEDVYIQTEAFDHLPEQIAASSTAGANIVMGERGFIGILGEGPFRVHHDGGQTLSLELAAGQEAWLSEDIAGPAGWRAFNDQQKLAVEPCFEAYPDYWSQIEYGTWVEQRAAALAAKMPEKPGLLLNDGFVDRLLERVESLSLPPGKFVIDDGWALEGADHLGDWLPALTRFTEIRKTAERISQAGHVPGIWLSPVQISRRCEWARRHPEQLIAWNAPSQGQGWGDALVKPGDAARRHYGELAERVIDWGFRKIKADLYYGPRALMVESLNQFAQAVHDVDPEVEVEGHLADPRLNDACGVVRTNDVLVNTKQDWRNLTKAHFTICAWSTPHKILNYDFIGGNDPEVTEADFREHGELYRQHATRGYACVGLLPDRFSRETQSWFRDLLEDIHRLPRSGPMVAVAGSTASS